MILFFATHFVHIFLEYIPLHPQAKRLRYPVQEDTLTCRLSDSASFATGCELHVQQFEKRRLRSSEQISERSSEPGQQLTDAFEIDHSISNTVQPYAQRKMLRRGWWQCRPKPCARSFAECSTLSMFALLTTKTLSTYESISDMNIDELINSHQLTVCF